jgi:hypothetical protein
MDREWTQDEIDEDVFRCEDMDDCDCLDAQEDILTGRVECFSCGRVWYAKCTDPTSAQTQQQER